MKIEKLYTLSQFVDYLDTLNIKDFSEITMYPITMTDMEWTSACFHLTKKYNEFLKQPLKKEMFVNEIEKSIRYYEFFNKASFGTFTNKELLKCNKYFEAEKKVIFEYFELKNNSINYKDVVHVFWLDSITQLWKLSNGMNTINDLSLLIYSSNFKLKNVEL